LSRKLDERVAELSKASKDATNRRAAVLMRVCDAYNSINKFFADLQAPLAPLIGVNGAVDAAVQIHHAFQSGARIPAELGILDVTGFLRRDWSRQPECEAEVLAIAAAVCDAIRRHAAAHERILVLGAGTGRLAYELRAAFGSDVVAIDVSVAMALTVLMLRRGRRRLYEIHETNVARTADQVREYDAEIPAAPEATDVTYVVGDALASPLADHSVNVVASIFFTDVVRPPRLIEEISRLLVPGGLFVHFGPLSYSIKSPANELTAEELTVLLRERGFRVEEDRWEMLPFQDSEAWLWRPGYRNWLMAAVRR
jgi:ubiquinone/menaquinone biosynthesis C-methylase UbiE